MYEAVIPTLTTDRLILRPPVVADFSAYEALWASPRSRYMGGPYDKFAAWGLFCHDVACWQLFGHGALMIERRETGECVGQVGINHGPLFPEKELGWLLYAGHEGRAMPWRRRGRCATGLLRTAGCRHWSAIATRPMRAPSRSPESSAPAWTGRRRGKIPTIWYSAITPKRVAILQSGSVRCRSVVPRVSQNRYPLSGDRLWKRERPGRNRANRHQW